MAVNLDDDLEWLIEDNEPVPVATKAEKKEIDDDAGTSQSNEEDPDSDLDVDDGLTEEERELLERNTILNDASDREDYDLKIKVEKANADLENADSNSSREVKVMFKRNLVDVEAPPIDYSSSSSSSSSSESEDEEVKHKSTSSKNSSDDKTDIKQPEEKEKILVERGGKFQFVNANEGTLESNKSKDKEQKRNISSSNVTPSTKPSTKVLRPNSAPTSSVREHRNDSTRPMSASRSSEYDHIKSPYAMSPEMKELMHKRAAARAAREEEEQAQNLLKQKENQQNAEYAWKCWMEKKNSEVREKKKVEQNNQPTKTYDSKKEAEEAYELWLKEKRSQVRKDRLLEQQQQLEFDEAWYRRTRKECDVAFKQWKHDKQKSARREKVEGRKSGQQSRSDVYRMRKIRRLIMSIESSKSTSYQW